jgi:DNA-directed RNA polymerase specialized sigma24 family protein
MEAEFITGINEHRRLIYKLINQYCKDENYKDDLFQDIICRAWTSFHTFRKECQFRQWIARIARNTAIDRLRRIKGTTLLVNNFLFDIVDEPYTEMRLPVSNTLSSIEKKTLDLYISGLTYTEISDITGDPPNRIAVRMHRIKKQLSKSIKQIQS